MNTLATRPTSYGIGRDTQTGTYYVMVNSQRAVTVPTCADALAFVDHDRELRQAADALVHEEAEQAREWRQAQADDRLAEHRVAWTTATAVETLREKREEPRA
jgi:hypothetical protein